MNRQPVRPTNLTAVKATHFCATLVVRTALILILVGAIAFGVLHARLSYAPISMSFVVPPIERAVNRNLSGLHFDIGNAVLRRSGSWLGIEFRLADVRLLDDQNSPVVESPFASADVSYAAFLTGQLAAGHIDLIGPKLYAQYSKERGIALSFTEPRDSKGDMEERRTPQVQSVPGASPDPQQRPALIAGNDGPAQTGSGMIREARGRAVSLTHAMTDLFARTRRGQSAYLNSFGIQDALVYFDQGEQITSWIIPSAQIDVHHRGQDTELAGNISIQSPSGSFQLAIRAEQDRETGQLALSLDVDDIVPRAFSNYFPGMHMPAMWDMPVSVAAQMKLARNGDILSGTVEAQLKEGRFYAPWEKVFPAIIDEGRLKASYSREQGLIQLSQAELRWGGSQIQMSGLLQRQRETGKWAFLFSTDRMEIGAEQFGLPVIPLDRMEAQGRYDPARGAVELDRFFVQAADANIALAGTIIQGNRSPAIKLTGRVSPMPIAFFKLIWPKVIAHGARTWIGDRVPTGRITGGEVDIDIPAEMLASLGSGGTLPPETVDFRLALEDLTVRYIEKMPPMQIETGTLRVAGQRFFFNVPKSRVVAPSGEVIHFSDGQFIIGDLRPNIPKGEIHFKSTADASAVLSLLDHPSLGYISALKMPVPEVKGTVESTFSIAMPLFRHLKFKDIKINGRSQLDNIQARNLPGGRDLDDGSLSFDVTEKAIESRGELKTSGVPVLVSWQRIFDAPPDRQPPLRIRTVLDENARSRLGLDVNHLIRGGAAAAVTVNFRSGQPPLTHFEFNLSEADLLMASLGWRKPPGRRAVLTAEMEPLEGSGYQIRNINLQGEDLAVKGELRIDNNQKPVAFDLPVVTLNSQTKLAINGRLSSGNVWKINVRGDSYDGRRFFRSLFSAGQIVENQPKLPEDAPGVDIDAELGTVIGFFNTTLENVKITARRRNNQLTSLDLLGQLNGERPLAARIQSPEGRARKILAEATDAGAAFRLVGFYPSARGGELSLDVSLEGSGGTQKSGVLYARNFSISNDQVVEEVLSSSSSNEQANARQRRAQSSDQLQFDRMRVPFSVGQGRFVVHDAAINGPILGATLRGAIDFKRERINLSGTYVPLYGINGALGFVPIFGDLLVSRSGEGLFGITFAVEGPTSKPDVKVNPLSVVAPGFLRQLFEFDQNEQRIIPQGQRRRGSQAGARSTN